MSSRRPEFAVIGVGLATLSVVIGALMFALVRTDGYASEVDRIERESVAPLDDLRAAASAFEDSQATFDAGVAAPTTEEAAARFSEALAESGSARQHWQDFVSAPIRFEGEDAARRAVDEAIVADATAGETLGVVVLDSANDHAEVMVLQAEQAQTHVELHRALRVLEEDYYLPALLVALDETRATAETTGTVLRNGVFAIGALGIGLVLFGYRRAAVRGSANRREQALQDAVANENALDADLQHALDMTDAEQQVYDVIERALAVEGDDRPASFLLADTVASRLAPVVQPDEDRGTRCAVPSPQQCPVIRSGREAIFASSDALDACTYLRAHEAAPCAAICMPVTVAGRSVGVIHECYASPATPEEHRIHELKIIARKAGERLSVLRALESSQVQAHTDPLTGLLNRRSLDEAVAGLGHEDLPYSVAYADLDHFKDLNDTFGHDIGDRALRLFSTVLRTSVRPNDVVARYGGEEFVVVLPSCASDVAVAVLERVQHTLADTVRTETTPPFTVSIGVATADGTAAFDDVLALADSCLLRAKDLGRDRIVVAGQPDAPMPMTEAQPPKR